MNLYLYRKIKKATYTIGKLYIGVEFQCNTLEDPVRDLIDLNDDGDFNDPDEGKIYGDTAIPADTYRIKMAHSPTFNRRMPYLQDVPGFTYIMMHNLSDVSQTKGCIGVGENTQQGRLVNSRAWSDLLNSKITAAENNGEDVWIEIND
jgi:hypothetical protein